MKINKIKMRNFKNNTCEQELTGKDLFTGHNGVGKSSRQQALLLSILGYIPGQDKKLQSIWNNSSSTDEMSVGIETDNFSFDRSIKQNETLKGKTLKESISVSPSNGEKKNSEKEARIQSEIGNTPVLLDFQNFLNMTATEKRKFIYSISSPNSEWNREKVKEYLKNKLNSKDDLIELKNCFKQYPENYTVEQGIQSMSDWSKEQLIYWKEEYKNTSGTVKNLTEIKNKGSETEAFIVENKKKIQELNSKLIDVEKQITASTERKNSLDEKNNKIKSLEKEIEDLKSLNNGSTGELEDKIKVLKSKFKNTDFNTLINKNNQELNGLKQELQAEENKIDAIIKNGTEKKVSIDNYSSILKKIKNTSGRCILDKKIKCDKDFSKYVQYIQENADSDMKQKNELAKQYREIKMRIKTLKEKIETVENNKNSLLKSEREENTSNNNYTQQINEYNNELNKIKNSLELKQEKIGIKQEELKNLKDEIIKNATEAPIIPVDMQEKQRNAIKLQITQLNSRVENQQDQKNSIEILKETALKNNAAKVKIKCLKKLSDALGVKGIQGQIIKDNLEPLRSLIQSNLEILGIENKFYFQCETVTGREVFQFGWINNIGQKVNFDTLSTGQQAILLIAFLTAIIEKSNPKIKILILDNMENLDSENFTKVISGLSKLSLKLDNIIISGVITDYEVAESNGFRVWNLDETINKEDNKEPEELEEVI